ncbi:hypothetical protein B0H19DRAFT_217107 [Neofusicoccum parvum]|uniref:Uncharacterized protein n=1 Tax=Neofusicoccum parvum TaxID=310453 RepID=A0ACB5RVW5_9PEZI|nr:hypothetical protein B0H19DRAFT_217107 [Neofusicoccum parvum]
MASHVFTATASIPISAAPEKVFALLTDRSTWPVWNTFIPLADLVSPAPISASPDDGKIQVGQKLHFHVRAKVFGKLRAVPGGSGEEVNILSTPADAAGERGIWRVGWKAADMPAWLFRAQRVNEVLAEEGGGCTYRTDETFDGPLAYLVKVLSGWLVREGLVMWAEGLKKEAEKGN